MGKDFKGIRLHTRSSRLGIFVEIVGGAGNVFGTTIAELTAGGNRHEGGARSRAEDGKQNNAKFS